MGWSHIMAGGLLMAVSATGCATLEHNRPACRWGSAGLGFVAGGLIGGFGVGSLDLSGTKQTGAIVSGVLGAGALGAVIGAVVGNYACPEAESLPPPEPITAPPPEPPPGQAP